MTRWTSVRCVKSRRVASTARRGARRGPGARPPRSRGRAIISVAFEVPLQGSAAKPRRARFAPRGIARRGASVEQSSKGRRKTGQRSSRMAKHAYETERWAVLREYDSWARKNPDLANKGDPI
jgi:hypothetical protein